MKKKSIEIKMGDINGLKDALMEVLAGIASEDEQTAVIGKVSEGLRLEYMLWQEQREDLEDEIEFKKEMLTKQVQRELTRLFEEKHNRMNQVKKDLWKKIKNELNLQEDLSLTINTKTGVVSQYIESDNEEKDSILN